MTQRKILIFWFPLFASWLLMTSEGPLISAIINRLPDEVIMLAAQGIVLSLSVTIESPIINLLATSTAKVRDRQSYLLVRRFTIHWMMALTVVQFVVAYTPVFDLIVIRGIGIMPDVARWVRVGLQINVIWSAAIAWRRFLQGVLIKFGRTEAMAQGTFVRLGSGAVTALAVALLTDAPGAVVGATTLSVAVVVEALFATWAVRPILANQLSPTAVSTGTALTYGELWRFHLPLASTALLTLLVQPLVAFSLSRLAQPTLSLAAWPILFQILLLARAPALASPEAIIALDRTPEANVALQRFVLTLAAASLAFMVLLVVTPLDSFYLFTVQDTTPAVAALVQQGLVLMVLFPAVNMLNFGLRGFLISSGATRPINTAMALNLSVTIVILFVGVNLKWGGILTAVLALNGAVSAETIYLAWIANRRGVLTTRSFSTVNK